MALSLRCPRHGSALVDPAAVVASRRGGIRYVYPVLLALDLRKLCGHNPDLQAVDPSCSFLISFCQPACG
jgi:hypothetical protein